MPINQFQRMVFAFITVIITVHAYVFYSLYVVNGGTLMEITGADGVLAAINKMGGVYMFGAYRPIWFVVIVEFVFAYILEMFMGSPCSLYDKRTNTLPVFINYNKSDDIQDTIKYEDHFVNESVLIAISKAGRSVESEDVQNFLKAEERGIKVELFVRKNKDDKISKEFYYLGRMKATGNVKEFVMENTNKTAVEIEWLLDTPVREDIYEYIVNN